MSAIIRADLRRTGKTTALLEWIADAQDDGAPLVVIVCHDASAAHEMTYRVQEAEIDPSRALVFTANQVRNGSALWGLPFGTRAGVDEWTLIPKLHRRDVLSALQHLSLTAPLFITADEGELLR